MNVNFPDLPPEAVKGVEGGAAGPPRTAPRR